MAAIQVFLRRANDPDQAVLGLYLNPGYRDYGKRYESSRWLPLKPLPSLELNWVRQMGWDDLDRLQEGEACFCTTTQDIWVRHNGQLMKVVGGG